MTTGTKQCTIFWFARYLSATAKAWFSQCTCLYIYIYGVHIKMVVFSNPGTYGTRKCSSWCADMRKSKDPEYKHPEIQHTKNPKFQNSKIPKIQKSKNPKIQKSKNPKMQNFLHLRILLHFLGFLDCWICLFVWHFLCFTLVVPICRNSSKIGFGKKHDVCVGIYNVFKGVRVS